MLNGTFQEDEQDELLNDVSENISSAIEELPLVGESIEFKQSSSSEMKESALSINNELTFTDEDVVQSEQSLFSRLAFQFHKGLISELLLPIFRLMGPYQLNKLSTLNKSFYLAFTSEIKTLLTDVIALKDIEVVSLLLERVYSLYLRAQKQNAYSAIPDYTGEMLLSGVQRNDKRLVKVFLEKMRSVMTSFFQEAAFIIAVQKKQFKNTRAFLLLNAGREAYSCGYDEAASSGHSQIATMIFSYFFRYKRCYLWNLPEDDEVKLGNFYYSDESYVVQGLDGKIHRGYFSLDNINQDDVNELPYTILKLTSGNELTFSFLDEFFLQRSPDKLKDMFPSAVNNNLCDIVSCILDEFKSSDKYNDVKSKLAKGTLLLERITLNQPEMLTLLLSKLGEYFSGLVIHNSLKKAVSQGYVEIVSAFLASPHIKKLHPKDLEEYFVQGENTFDIRIKGNSSAFAQDIEKLFQDKFPQKFSKQVAAVRTRTYTPGYSTQNVGNERKEPLQKSNDNDNDKNKESEKTNGSSTPRI